MTIALAYLIVALIVGRVIAANEYRDCLNSPKYHDEAKSSAVWSFLIAGAAWPIVGVICLGIGIHKLLTGKLKSPLVSMGNFMARLMIGKGVSVENRRKELEKRRQRVKELERELELDG